MTRNPRRERRRKRWQTAMRAMLPTRFAWADLAFGAASTVLIAGLLLGFRFQAFPDYKVGDIAAQDVRAPQDVTYVDEQATAERRAAARERIPALYELEVYRIADLENRLSLSFSAARDLLSAQHIPPKGRLTASQQQAVLGPLEEAVGRTIPPRFLPLLLQYRFDVTFETRILQILVPVLLNGLVEDPELYRRHVQGGAVLRDRSTVAERPLTNSSRVRSVEEAREYLRQSHLEFAELPAPERATLFSFMDTLVIPTLVHNAAETTARRDAAAARVTPVEVLIKKGKTIIRAGEEVTARAGADLAALRNLRRPRPVLARLSGLVFFVGILLYAMWRYFSGNRMRYRKIRTNAALAVTVLALVIIIMRLLTVLADILGQHLPAAELRDPVGLYFAIPFSMAALLVTLLIDIHVGLIVSMLAAALVGLFYGDTYFAIYALVGNLAGAFSISHSLGRSGLAKSGLRIGLVNAFAAFGIHMLRQDLPIWSELLTTMAMGLLGGLLASALSSLILPALESMFRITTDIRLLELSNLNAPILRRLSVEAPGTYHHSLMVGTLAEAAAEAIGGNPLLARVGAYYHDVGKMLKPEYFAENQAAGLNKHTGLTPSMSCLILTSHVKDGLELAERAGVMETIRDMIPQHHGTRIMAYFYQKAKELASAGSRDISEEDFRYPGPKPQSKEAAILMMADSVEAASRTLSNPSPAQLQGMIDRLVDDVLADGQLEECDITLRDIRLVKESFLKTISGFQHNRIDYPGYDFRIQDNGLTGMRPQETDARPVEAGSRSPAG